MAQFSSNEAVSLSKTINNHKQLANTPDEHIYDYYDIKKCIYWIQSNEYKKVCLQFPDYLLPDSPKVANHLQNELQQTVYVLGDTAYESCCIDYVAAAHIDADAVIHFGPMCFSQPTCSIPSLFIHEKHKLNIEEFLQIINTEFSSITDCIIVVIDSPLLHLKDNICFNQNNIIVKSITDSDLNVQESTVIYVGENDRKLMNFNFIHKPKQLYYYYNGNLSSYDADLKILKRRYFLIEKIKDSETVGIIVGTLAIKNYLKIIERMKKLLKLNGKKFYMISVGKPTVAKLANFPEMHVYILIGCAMNEIYESRDFYRPIVTPYDVEVALNSNASTDLKFSYDFNSSIAHDSDNLAATDKSDVSLISGNIRYNSEIKMNEESRLVLKESSGALIESHGAGFLANRSWTGLEQNLGQTEVMLAVDGRSGIAQGYANELEL
ncbi:PREDICTED: diphthamide biosynthesis protein 2 [Nicrophorus vespilloides]|uniref:Diphthamide biosynthesis protein 2 n=1 Tax=Nicrophorus vespilloides TaxID=110193 RepID=A0ABM1N3D2_NICVS|nr:PREDICTED: diphthamide biosynthesis protein 2 [Nicrophorus vespilloides]